MRRSWLLLLMMSLLGLTACIPNEPPRSCDSVTHTALRSLIQETYPVDQARQRVTATFGLREAEISIQPLSEGTPPAVIKTLPLERGGVLRWTSDGTQYELLLEGAQPVVARATYQSAAPTGDRLMQCLGKPDKYWGFFYPSPSVTRRLTVLTLFYPEIGGSCWIEKYGSGERPPSFASTDVVAGCDFVPPTPAEQAIPRLLSRVTAPSAAQWVEERLRAWPADWSNIVVETEPLP